MKPEKRYGAWGPGRVEGFRDGMNVHELGGYEAACGGHIRHGLLFRSATPALMLPEERARLVELGIRHVIDLRSAAECDRLPEPQLHGAAYERICGLLRPDGNELDFSPQGIVALMPQGYQYQGTGLLMADSVGYVQKLYLRMPFDNPAFRRIFALMEEGEVPLLFHCTAGKDRTGVAAMLVLLALGVSEEEATFEYLLTNKYRAKAIADARLKRHREFPNDPDLAEQMAQAEGVSEVMARDLLSAIRERCGSIEAYLAQEYGLQGARLDSLRQRFLE